MYEPHLDVKYLLQYREFKVYAITLGLLMTVINSVPEVEFSFLFVEAQVSSWCNGIINIWGPILFICGLIASSLVLVFFSKTNRSYQLYMLLLLVLLIGSLVFGMLAFASSSPGFYGLTMIL